MDLVDDERDLWLFFDSLEDLEALFDIEFSCGDGLFLSDLDESDFDAFRKYDGEVDWSLFRKNEGDGTVCKTEDYYIRFMFDENPREETYTDCKILKYRRHRHD